MKRASFIFFLLTLGISLWSQIPQAEMTLQTSTNRIDVNLSIPEGFQQGYNPTYFGIDLPSTQSVASSEILFPEGFSEGDYLSGTVTLSVLLQPTQTGQVTLPITIRTQLCDLQGSCFRPTQKVMEATVPLDVNALEATGTALEASDVNAEELSLLWVFLFAFLGGVLLNIMPCVLPVLSLKAFSLLKQSGSQRREIFINSILYSSGILLSMVVLALATIFLQISGQGMGWGFQFQSLGYLIFLIVLLVAVALALLDVLVIVLPGGMKSRTFKSHYGESFFTGVLAVLLATPCTAPLLGAAVGFALTKSAPVILAVFLLIGLGLALPFLLLGFFPQVVRFFPRPGQWMNVVKELTGFILLGVVLWLLSVLGSQVGVEALVGFLTWLLLFAFGAYLWKNFGVLGRSRWVRWGVVVLILAMLIPTAFQLFPLERIEKEESGSVYTAYEDFSPEAVAAAVEAGERVLVVFSADWCLTCKTNESRVLASNEIQQLFKEKEVRLFYGDYTNYDETISQWITRYQRSGVPFVLYIYQDQQILLPELLTKGKIKSLLQ